MGRSPLSQNEIMKIYTQVHTLSHPNPSLTSSTYHQVASAVALLALGSDLFPTAARMILSKVQIRPCQPHPLPCLIQNESSVFFPSCSPGHQTTTVPFLLNLETTKCLPPPGFISTWNIPYPQTHKVALYTTAGLRVHTLRPLACHILLHLFPCICTNH